MASSFLNPSPSRETWALYDGDKGQVGYVMNLSRVWAHNRRLHDGLFDLVDELAEAAGLSVPRPGPAHLRRRVHHGRLLLLARLGQPAGRRLRRRRSPRVLRHRRQGLDDRERTRPLGRRVARDPNGTTAEDVEPLRAVGYDDAGAGDHHLRGAAAGVLHRQRRAGRRTRRRAHRGRRRRSVPP